MRFDLRELHFETTVVKVGIESTSNLA